MPNSGFLGFAEASEFCLAQDGVQGVLVHEAFVGVVRCCTCAHDDLRALMGPPKLRMERRPCKRCAQFRSWPLAMYGPRPLAIKRVLRVLQPLAAEQVQHGVFHFTGSCCGSRAAQSMLHGVIGRQVQRRSRCAERCRTLLHARYLAAGDAGYVRLV